MGFDARGNLKWVALYYDPILDRVHGNRRVIGLFPALYVAPQDKAVGELLYRNAVAEVGWDKRWLPVVFPGVDPRPLTVAFLLAREYGDHTTERTARAQAGGDRELALLRRRGRRGPGRVRPLLQVRRALPARAGERALPAEGPAGRRRRLVARLQPAGSREVHGADRDGRRVSRSSASRSPATTPRAASSSWRATRRPRALAERPRDSRVRNLPDASAAHVRRDGAQHAGWRATSASSIEIETTIDTHRYQIYTGYRGSLAKPAGEAPESVAAGSRALAAAPPARERDRSLPSAVALRRRAAASCPCCGIREACRSQNGTWRISRRA